MIMESERFHHLSSASWRSRKAGGVAPSKLGGLRTKIANSVRSGLSPEAAESGALRSEGRRK